MAPGRSFNLAIAKGGRGQLCLSPGNFQLMPPRVSQAEVAGTM